MRGFAPDHSTETDHRIDRAMSPHKEDSELSRINRDAGSGAVPVSPEMARLIVRAAEFSAQMADGTYAYGGVTDALWMLNYLFVGVAALAAHAPAKTGNS